MTGIIFSIYHIDHGKYDTAHYKAHSPGRNVFHKPSLPSPPAPCALEIIFPDLEGFDVVYGGFLTINEREIQE